MKKKILILIFLLAGTVAAQQLAFQDEPDSGPVNPGAESEIGSDTPEPTEEPLEPEEDQGSDDSTGGPDESDETTDSGLDEEDIPELDESDLTTEIEDEFEPTEEISEDYPVPLPSDI